jgi:hypothetical protein
VKPSITTGITTAMAAISHVDNPDELGLVTEDELIRVEEVGIDIIRLVSVGEVWLEVWTLVRVDEIGLDVMRLARVDRIGVAVMIEGGFVRGSEVGLKAGRLLEVVIVADVDRSVLCQFIWNNGPLIIASATVISKLADEP